MSGGEAVPLAYLQTCKRAQGMSSVHEHGNLVHPRALLSSQSGLCRLWKLGILKLGDALAIEYPVEGDADRGGRETAILRRSRSGYYLYCKPVRKKGQGFRSVFGFIRHVLSCSPPRQSLPKRHPLRVALCPKVTEEKRLLNLAEHWVTFINQADRGLSREVSFWGRLHGRLERPSARARIWPVSDEEDSECNEEDTGPSAARLSAVPLGKGAFEPVRTHPVNLDSDSDNDSECDEGDTGPSAARLSAVPLGKGAFEPVRTHPVNLDSDSDSSDSSSTCGSLSSTHSSEVLHASGCREEYPSMDPSITDDSNLESSVPSAESDVEGYQDEYPSSTDPSITDDSNPDSSVPSALAVESDLPVLQWPAKLSAANDLLESNALVQHLYDAHIVRGPCLDTLSLKISESISHTASIYCEYGCYCIAQGNAGLTPGKRLRWYTLTSWAMAVLGLSSDVKARQVVRHLLHRSTLYGERVVLVPHLKSLSIEKYGPIKKKGGEGKDGAAEDTPEQGAASEVGGGDAPPSKKRRKDDDEPVLPCQGEYE
eukprot:TRINITY_DN10857_c0_g1_i2.p1 TRINITY_DN10857_c0_g1~~TRINITY_DN10857_c0_g1_i2.p1  ORF type:complete len:541 (+),score=68.18 TRINITY_DN10857_c0_g1_i2:72-1694(+)